jgi:glycosyltransferase involved in cell wall biosynthesis/SAM-dependent methyltransferase
LEQLDINHVLKHSAFSKDQALNIWLQPQQANFSYNDGDEAENYLLQVTQNATDLSTYSDELKSKIKDWPSNYHLSSRRSNLLWPFKAWFKNKRILEIGCGCGAITRFLGETGAQVISVEGSLRRAQIARSRCRDLNNVEIICAPSSELPNLGKFDAVLLIGVLEYARVFLGPNGQALLLDDCYSRLTNEGRLFLAIENKLGIKYFAGANEDHVGQPMFSINDLYTEQSVATFGRQELISLLNTAQFINVEEFIPLPDYKLPVSVVTPLGWQRYADKLTSLAVESAFMDTQGVDGYLFSLEKATANIWQNNLAPDMENSFLMIAAKSPSNEKVVPTNEAAYHFSTDRLASFGKIITFLGDEQNKLSILTEPLPVPDKRPHNLLIQKIDKSTHAFIAGENWLFSLIKIVNHPNWELIDIAHWAKQWVESLLRHFSLPLTYDKNTKMPASAFDAMPFNTIQTRNNEFFYFDLEWSLEEPDISLGYVVFRGIFHSLSRITSFACSESIKTKKAFQLAFEVIEAMGLQISLEEQDIYLAREARFLSAVSNITEETGLRSCKNVHINMRIIPTRQTLEEFEHRLQKTQQQLQETQQQLQDTQEKLNNTYNQLHQVYQSSSWRITSPARKLINICKAFMRKFKPYQAFLKRIINLAPKYAKESGGWKNVYKKSWDIFRKQGFSGLKQKLLTLPHLDHSFSYQNWIAQYDTLSEIELERIEKNIHGMVSPPLLSIVMPVYNPSAKLLRETIESVQNQLYPFWELCIADDASSNQAIQRLLTEYAQKEARIKITFREKNGHISAASNSALALATGDFIALLDHDDLLPKHALYEIACVINKHPEISMIYSDEDKITEQGQRFDPYFKSDWDPDLFLGQNLFSHLGVYRRTLVDQVGGFNIGLEGSQDYDLALRCWEKVGDKAIYHIPKILYHWRVTFGSTAATTRAKPYAFLASIKAKESFIARNNINAEVIALETLSFTRIKYKLPQTPPLVSIIIPTRDGYHLIKQCIDSIFQKTHYPNYEIVIIDNGSTEARVLEFFEMLKSRKNITIMRDDSPFNYSALNNKAVKICKGDILCLLNNDIEVITPDWLNEMVSQAIRPEIGAVGACLWYPNDTLQHGGVILGIGGIAGHAHHGITKADLGYFSRAKLVQNYSAVTAACLVVKKSVYQKVGGLNEINLKVAFNDVDFCIRVKNAGYRNLWTPFAELYHHESATRGPDTAPDKVERFNEEINYMKHMYGDSLLYDPAYNINLDLYRENYTLAFPPRPYKL